MSECEKIVLYCVTSLGMYEILAELDLCHFQNNALFPFYTLFFFSNTQRLLNHSTPTIFHPPQPPTHTTNYHHPITYTLTLRRWVLTGYTKAGQIITGAKVTWRNAKTSKKSFYLFSKKRSD